MPKLLLFAPCEKVIVNQEDNTTSLITLLEALNVSLKAGDEAKIPEDANLPLSWHVLALWQIEPSDEGKQWEQRVLLDVPKGIEIVQAIRFEPGKTNWRNVIHILGLPIFPLLTVSSCLLKLFLRESGDGESQPWQLVSEYPLIILHPVIPIIDVGA